MIGYVCKDHALPTIHPSGECTVQTELPPYKATDVSVETLLWVLDGWLGQDDWSMPTLPYPDTVREIYVALRHGDDPKALRTIAKVTKGVHPRHYAKLAAACPYFEAHNRT